MVEEKLVPNLRFRDYSDDWKEYTLGEILTFYSTNSFSRAKMNYEDGEVKNIHYGDIHTVYPTIVNLSTNKDVPFINKDEDLSRFTEDQYLKNGDLIIADASEDYADIGKAIEVCDVADEKVLAGLHTILARDEKNITVNGFKAYLFSFEGLKTKIKIIANGISVLGISKNNLSKLKVKIPSKEEQQKIVNFISLIEKKIELLEQKHQYYQDFKKYLMQQIFAQKLRFDGFNDEWLKTTLGDISSDEMYGMNSASKDYDGFNKYIRITDISETSNKFIPDPLTSPDGNLEDKYKLKNGDIVFARTGASTGKTYLYDECDGNLYFAGFLIKFHIDKANPLFIFYNTQREEYLNWVKVMSVRSGQPGINSNEYKKLPINLPSIKEQEKIADFLSNIDKKIETIQTQISEITEFKKGLLQQMFI